MSQRESGGEPAGRPRLDLFAHGPLSEILERFRSRLLKEADRVAGSRPINANDLERAYDRLLSRSSENWQVLNRRRIFLIHKQVAGDISLSETAELETLQLEADRHMSEVAPRPLESLWDLKRSLTEE